MNISIAGLDKADVLAALYNATHTQGMGYLHYDPKLMTKEKAQIILDGRMAERLSLYFDYLKGRVMKVDLSGDTLAPGLYDRDNYDGAVQAVISALRLKVSQDKNIEV